MTTISPVEMSKLLSNGEKVDFIDVRTPAEYASVHAVGARLAPVDDLDVKAILESRVGQASDPIYVLCKAGTRGRKACEKFHAAGVTNVVNVEGGTDAWIAAGLPVERGTSNVLPLDRQVRIAAGLMVCVGAALAWQVHPVFIGLCAFVGAGLVFAGLTDICPMATLVAKMPWNQASCPGGTCSCSRK